MHTYRLPEPKMPWDGVVDMSNEEDRMLVDGFTRIGIDPVWGMFSKGSAPDGGPNEEERVSAYVHACHAYVFVFLYVCVYVCICVYMHVLNILIKMHTYTYTCTHIHEPYTPMRRNKLLKFDHDQERERMYTCIHATYMYFCIFHVFFRMEYARLRSLMLHSWCIHTHTHTYITYIHTHIHFMYSSEWNMRAGGV